MAKFCTRTHTHTLSKEGRSWEGGNPESKESQRTNVYGSNSNSESNSNCNWNCDSNGCVAIAITHMDTQNICKSKQRSIVGTERLRNTLRVV